MLAAGQRIRLPCSTDDKETLHSYLRIRRGELLTKLDGLGEYDIPRPLTPTGTNLLGLVKHVAGVELGYFDDVFGRPSGRHLSSEDPSAAPDADMWATAGESRADIVELHHFAARHADATIQALPLNAAGKRRGGLRSAGGSACIGFWSICASRRPSMPATQTSSGN